MNAYDPFVVTTKEKLRFEQQFNALGPVNGIVTGVQAKGFLLKSGLSPYILGQIWALADTDADGKMNIIEFSIACKLISLKLRNVEVPKLLPPTLIASLQHVGTPIRTPTGSLSPVEGYKTILNAATSASPIPTMSVQPQPAQPIIPPMMTSVPPIVPVAGVGAPMIPVASMIPPQIPPQPLIGGTAPLIGGIGAMQQPLIGGIQPQIPVNAQPILPMGTVLPTQQPPAAIPYIPNTAATAIPNTAAIAPSKPLIDTQSNVSLLDSLHQTAPIIPQPPAAVPVVPVAPNLPAGPTPPQSGTNSRSMSFSEKVPSIESPSAPNATVEWAIKGPTKLKYTQLFNATDKNRTGFLTGSQARGILLQSKLPHQSLAQIWALSDMDSDGRLGCEEFVLAMYLCDQAIQGEKVPTTLPLELIPPSFRKTTSRHGSVAGSRHGSVSSQGTPSHAVEIDATAGLPQTSFEDKRKENFDKGQAELERRRKVLADIQRKEQEERDRKEREEAEKREKARLEAEMKKQQELERELQRQRELEQEREEQRKRELEKKEQARKEMEKQRQLEWENQKLQEMEQERQREQDRLLKLKGQNQTLTIELESLNSKVKELSQKICDTRVGVTNVKSVIDGMRTTRDTQMSEMTQLKARIKEQNQRLVQLSQEKAKLDAKTKANPSTDDQAVFTNKQIIIKQLQDKLENTKAEIEAKNSDITTHDDELEEIKTQLKDLISDCEQLYNDYDVKRIQVLELKNNRKNESFTSAWDTANSWGTEPTATAVPATTTSEIPAAAESDVVTPPGFVKYRALYEFFARNTDEISFQPGDIVMVPLEQHAEPGWLAGEINGHTGWFPESYVEKVNPADAGYTYEPVESRKQLEGIEEVFEPQVAAPVAAAVDTSTYNGDVGEVYIACYPYQSTEVGDLVFDAGETIRVIKKEGDWWTGVVGTRTGIFPSNYVQPSPVAQPPAEEAPIETGSFDKVEEPSNLNGNTAAITEAQQHAMLEEAKNQADADSEVSQINTQTPSNDSNVQEYRSMSTSATPSLRAKKGEVAQVIAPYEATGSEQLSLQRGQLIMIRKKTDSGWWEGELQAKGRRRQVGWFPATYVKVLQGGRNSGRNTPVSASKIDLHETILDKVIALYPYKAINDDELSFEKDDIISVLGRDEPEWWRGELNGIVGLFPSNYVGPFVTSGNV